MYVMFVNYTVIYSKAVQTIQKRRSNEVYEMMYVAVSLVGSTNRKKNDGAFLLQMQYRRLNLVEGLLHDTSFAENSRR